MTFGNLRMELILYHTAKTLVTSPYKKTVIRRKFEKDREILLGARSSTYAWWYGKDSLSWSSMNVWWCDLRVDNDSEWWAHSAHHRGRWNSSLSYDELVRRECVAKIILPIGRLLGSKESTGKIISRRTIVVLLRAITCTPIHSRKLLVG